MATSAVGLTVMLLLATTVFGLSFFVYGVLLVPFLLVLFLFGVALGICACAIVLRLGPASEWLIWPIPALLSPLACVFYPRSALPVWMQYLTFLLPPSWVFEAMRKVVAGRSPSPWALLGSAGLTLSYVVLAACFFTRIYRYAVRSGLIARYSAESVS
jgi:ABC-2 type transport system permease protein